jgi:hypothetical protein
MSEWVYSLHPSRAIMANDPCVAGGYARGELRPFRVSLLRGRD